MSGGARKMKLGQQPLLGCLPTPMRNLRVSDPMTLFQLTNFVWLIEGGLISLILIWEHSVNWELLSGGCQKELTITDSLHLSDCQRGNGYIPRHNAFPISPSKTGKQALNLCLDVRSFNPQLNLSSDSINSWMEVTQFTLLVTS